MEYFLFVLIGLVALMWLAHLGLRIAADQSRRRNNRQEEVAAARQVLEATRGLKGPAADRGRQKLQDFIERRQG